MVDVGDKAVTHRVAVAEARVRLPRAVARALRASGHRTGKGPVFDTAIVAGVMAAKRTHELIPFCHPLGDRELPARASSTGGRRRSWCAAKSPCITGPASRWRRSPALRRGAHDLRHVQGAVPRHRDRQRAAAGQSRRPARALRAGCSGGAHERGASIRPAVAPLYGLVLAGGRSTRMGRDKAALAYDGRAAARARHGAAAAARGARVRLGARRAGGRAAARALCADRRYATRASGRSPACSPRRQRHPDAAWLVLACDLPLLDAATLAQLLRARDPAAHRDRLSLEPRRPARAAVRDLRAAQPRGARGRRRRRAGTARASSCWRGHAAASIEPKPRALDNINTPQEYGSL